MTLTLTQLVADAPGVMYNTGDTDITAPVVEAHTDLQPGGVFVARAGITVDGHDFIDEAIQRGAAAIVGEREIYNLAVPYVRVLNAQEATGHIAAAYFDFPSRQLTIIGVTGTDGKTTTSTLIHSILGMAIGGRVGLISTVGAHIGDKRIDTGLHVTTPGAPQIQALLAEMVKHDLTHVVIETTSHGLAQRRLNGVDFDVAVITNLSQEHLDYHGSFENYRAAKAHLFGMLRRSERKPNRRKTAVINADDANADYYAALVANSDVEIIRYGIKNEATYRASNIRYEADRTRFDLPDVWSDVWDDDANREFTTYLLGEFNVMNSLAAIAATCDLIYTQGPAGIDAGLSAVQTIPGRMERIDEGQDFIAIVDFAHTPNSLQSALRATRKMVADDGRLIVVFGSAGLRDRDKRRAMAEIGVQLADFSIFTAEDPRTESLDAILEKMADAARAVEAVEGTDFVRVPDRGEAIFQACQMARKGDVVLVCGKGHEQSMCFGKTEYPWDDRKATRAALGGEPPRTLPTANEGGAAGDA